MQGPVHTIDNVASRYVVRIAAAGDKQRSLNAGQVENDVGWFNEARTWPHVGTAPGDQDRSTHRHRPVVPDDEPRLVARLIALATTYGRYGYRRITGLLRGEGWHVNHKRVERLWRREGLTVPQKQPKLRR